MEVAAGAAHAKSLSAGEAQFIKAAVGYVIHLTECSAKLGTAVSHAGIVPQAVGYGDVIIVLSRLLCALLQISSPHYPQEYSAVELIEPGEFLHNSGACVLLSPYDLYHITACDAVCLSR